MTDMDCGVSRSGASVLVAVALRVATNPCTGPVAVSARAVGAGAAGAGAAVCVRVARGRRWLCRRLPSTTTVGSRCGCAVAPGRAVLRVPALHRDDR